MKDKENQQKKKPKLIVFKEGKYYRSVEEMTRKNSREIKKDNGD